MKRSSSSLDPSAVSSSDEFHSNSAAKMVCPPSRQFVRNNEEEDNSTCRKTSMAQRVGGEADRWSPSYSSIVGYSANSSIYVIHLLDPYLAWRQSVEVCSIFGRIRVHGCHLCPLQFYAIHNYRTNSPLPIELDLTTTTTRRSVSLAELQSLIGDRQLAESAFTQVQQKGGDLLLLRRIPVDQSRFLQIMQTNQRYSYWFSGKYSSSTETNQWRQLERDLNIHLIEATDQSVVLPRNQLITTADHIIERWQNESTKVSPFVVLICGEKDMGKSTVTRYLVNRAIDKIDSNFAVTYFDCDLGQCEFTMSGCLSYTNIDSPLLGPPCSHILSNPKPDRLIYYGLNSPQPAPVRYLSCVNQLRKMWNRDQQEDERKRSIIFINTMGWGTGLGLELLKETICMCMPNIIVQLAADSSASNTQQAMPDITLSWLLGQPVFLPYRQKQQMRDQRVDDYDGQLNFEYFKLQSKAPSKNVSKGVQQLQARDHRILATWSYFFSKNLSRFSLPISQIVHVYVTNNKTLPPKDLKQSIVALCTSDDVNALRQRSLSTNGVLHLRNDQDECFECHGFGWIERYDEEKCSYEIFTPIDDLSNINLLVFGTFDTPDGFSSMIQTYIH